jgi:5-methylcytosine-specific restriction endonuclease McrBC regulatory subunit McrC
LRDLQEWLEEKLGDSFSERQTKKQLNCINEHETILESIPYEDYENLKDYFNLPAEEPSPLKSLGLYWELNVRNYRFNLKAFYYVGYWWISKEEKVYVRVSPKVFKNGYGIDFAGVLKEILEDGEILDVIYKDLIGDNPSRQLIHFDFNAPLIPLKDDAEEHIVFTILSFIYILEKIVKKGLKRDYVKVRENLNSRLRGKLIVKETLQRNFLRGNLTRVICNFYRYSEDSLENRILKTTLIQVKKFLFSEAGKILRSSNVEEKVSFLLHGFEKVKTVVVNQYDFQRVKYSPFYQEYKQALLLAKVILQRLGFDPFSHLEGDNKNNLVVPYCINMPLLFELYAYKWLKEKFLGREVIYQKSFYDSSGKEYIPDFLIKKSDENEGIIADAKYKYIENNDPSREDKQQLSLYGRLKELRKFIGIEEDKEPEIWFLIPTFDSNRGKEEIKSFSKMFKIFINLPKKRYE